MQSLGEAQVPEVVPLTDLRGAAVEDGGDFPVVPGTPPAYLVVQVADMEEQGSCEGQEEISSDHIVLLAPPMRARSVAFTALMLGMLLAGRAGAPVHVPARAREVFDVSGAGDTVIATAALALMSGATIQEAAILANAAAGVVVAKIGTATCSPEELLKALPGENKK